MSKEKPKKEKLSFLRKLTRRLAYKEERKIEIPSSWRKQEVNPTTTLKPNYTVKKVTKVRLPWLKTTKRFLAGIMSILNGFFGLGSMVNPNTQVLGLFFLLNTFLCLDYLWKTSSWRIVRE